MKTFLALLLLAASAHSSVIYSGLQDISLPYNAAGIFVNLNDATTSVIEPSGYTNGTAPWMFFSFGGSGIGTSPLVRTVVTGSVFAGAEQTANLAYGSTVGPTSRFSVGDAGYNGSETHIGASLNQFQLGTQGYIGYEFTPTVGGPAYFAVARVTLHNDGVSATLHDWSYENTPGAPITVPEPSRTLLGLAGLLVTLARRRRPHPPSHP
jgi:hypothetical protein